MAEEQKTPAEGATQPEDGKQNNEGQQQAGEQKPNGTQPDGSNSDGADGSGAAGKQDGAGADDKNKTGGADGGQKKEIPAEEIVYDFKLPEGVKADDKKLSEFTEKCKAGKISKETAQEMLKSLL
jgi:hypothetical protein